MLVMPSEELQKEVENSFEKNGFILDKIHKEVENPKYVDERRKNIHYQIVSENNDNKEDDLENQFNILINILNEIGDRFNSPITMNMSLLTDGTITAGIDIRAMFTA